MSTRVLSAEFLTRREAHQRAVHDSCLRKSRWRSLKVFPQVSAKWLVAIQLSTCECGVVLILRDKCVGGIAIRVSSEQS